MAMAYFMTQDQQDAALGRLIREQKETEKRLALLKSEAIRISLRLNTLANTLERYPQSVFFEGEEIGVHYILNPFNPKDKNVAFSLNVEDISRLTADIRSAMETLEKLKQQSSEAL
jgi:hypothetical protein